MSIQGQISGSVGWESLKHCVEEMCRRGGSGSLARNVACPGDQAINVENSLACDFGCLFGAVYKFSCVCVMISVFYGNVSRGRR
jgi:hypothetical protein